jgi:hypothetical protein
MKIAYIATQVVEIKKPTKKQELHETPLLIASQSRNSLSSPRQAQKILDLVING